MKTRIFALAVALAMPASAQAATLAIPESHTFLPDFGFSVVVPGTCCGFRAFFIDHLSGGGSLLEEKFLVVNSSLSGIPGFMRLVGDSVTFVVLDDTDSFRVGIYSDIGTGLPFVSLREIVTQVPVPAALPLFAAGLGIVAFIARRRKRAA